MTYAKCVHIYADIYAVTIQVHCLSRNCINCYIFT